MKGWLRSGRARARSTAAASSEASISEESVRETAVMQACRHGHSMSRFEMDDAATRVGIVAAQGLERYMTASHEVSAVRRPAAAAGVQ